MVQLPSPSGGGGGGCGSSSNRRSLLLLPFSSLLLLLCCCFSSSASAQAVPNVTQVLSSSGNFTTFLSLAGPLNVTDALQSFISSGNTTGATAFVPLNSAFTPEIVSAYTNLSSGNQTNLLLYHVLPAFYNRTAVVGLSNASTLATKLPGQFLLTAVNQTSAGVVVFATASAANVTSANVSGIPNPPAFPIAIYPIDAVLLPLEIFPPAPGNSTSTSSSTSALEPSPAPASAAAAASSSYWGVTTTSLLGACISLTLLSLSPLII